MSSSGKSLDIWLGSSDKSRRHKGLEVCAIRAYRSEYYGQLGLGRRSNVRKKKGAVMLCIEQTSRSLAFLEGGDKEGTGVFFL